MRIDCCSEADSSSEAATQAIYDRICRENKLKNYSFAQLNLAVITPKGCLPRFMFGLYWLSSFWHFYSFVSDGFVLWSLQDQGKYLALGLYMATVCISFLLLGKTLVEAREIIETDDVSDIYTNAEAYRLKAAGSFQTYSLFQLVNSALTIQDGLIRTMHLTLQYKWRLTLVSVPQFVIGILMLGTLHKAETSLLLMLSMIVKIALLSMSMIQLIISVVGYPFFNSFLQDVFKPKAGEHINLRIYVSYLVDNALNAVVHIHKCEGRGVACLPEDHDILQSNPEVDEDDMPPLVSW